MANLMGKCFSAMNWMKRALDLVIASIGLVILSPLLLVVAVVIFIDDGSPVLFRQERIGRHGKPFHILKFRSMGVDAERIGGQITVGNDPRITRIGQFLRRSKIDELPQLINVVRGEMSLVGPRPEVPKYVALYTPEERHVLSITPGITDPASIKYRHESEILARSSDPEQMYIEVVMPEKIRLNLEYAKEATVWTDFQILLSTLWSLVKDHDRNHAMFG